MCVFFVLIYLYKSDDVCVNSVVQNVTVMFGVLLFQQHFVNIDDVDSVLYKFYCFVLGFF